MYIHVGLISVASWSETLRITHQINITLSLNASLLCVSWECIRNLTLSMRIQSGCCVQSFDFYEFTFEMSFSDFEISFFRFFELFTMNEHGVCDHFMRKMTEHIHINSINGENRNLTLNLALRQLITRIYIHSHAPKNWACSLHLYIA